MKAKLLKKVRRNYLIASADGHYYILYRQSGFTEIPIGNTTMYGVIHTAITMTIGQKRHRSLIQARMMRRLCRNQVRMMAKIQAQLK